MLAGDRQGAVVTDQHVPPGCEAGGPWRCVSDSRLDGADFIFLGFLVGDYVETHFLAFRTALAPTCAASHADAVPVALALVCHGALLWFAA